MQVSVEKPFEAWGEVQRHGQDLADRLAQGFTDLIQFHITAPTFSWPEPPKLFDVEFPGKGFGMDEFEFSHRSSGVESISAILSHVTTSVFSWPEPLKLLHVDFPGHVFGIKDLRGTSGCSGVNGITAILEIGNKLGQVGADVGACFNGMLQQVFRWFPVIQQEENAGELRQAGYGIGRNNVGVALQEGWRTMVRGVGNFGVVGNGSSSEESVDVDLDAPVLVTEGHSTRSKGSFSITSTYESRSRNVENTFVARGDLWRLEVSRGRSISGSENSSLVLFQLGPVLLVRDSTVLLPLHLSKQHLLWYGYDRKNGLHSICPAIWSKRRKWLLMSMICIRPLTCSFVELQFPNGQLTYVSGEGISTNAYLPIFGGLLQAEGQYPGEMRFSFSYKNKWGTRITPMVQWPDKFVSLGLEQGLYWRRSGLLMRPRFQFSINPTLGGSNSGLQAEFVHSLKDELNFACGCALTAYPTAFTSVSIGRCKWNGNLGNSGLVIKAESPLSSISRPSFSVQFNSGVEF